MGKNDDYVVHGATLKCTMGSKSCSLKVTSNRKYKIKNKNVATEMDFAPGMNILSLTDIRNWEFVYNGTIAYSGTSQAAPHVSGVAALVLSVNPNLTGQEVRCILESTAQKVRKDLYTYDSIPERPNGTWNEQVGHGLVDAHAAVLKAKCYSDMPIQQKIIAQNTTWNTPNICVRYCHCFGRYYVNHHITS